MDRIECCWRQVFMIPITSHSLVANCTGRTGTQMLYTVHMWTFLTRSPSSLILPHLIQVEYRFSHPIGNLKVYSFLFNDKYFQWLKKKTWTTRLLLTLYMLGCIEVPTSKLLSLFCTLACASVGGVSTGGLGRCIHCTLEFRVLCTVTVILF